MEDLNPTKCQIADIRAGKPIAYSSLKTAAILNPTKLSDEVLTYVLKGIFRYVRCTYFEI